MLDIFKTRYSLLHTKSNDCGEIDSTHTNNNMIIEITANTDSVLKETTNDFGRKCLIYPDFN